MKTTTTKSANKKVVRPQRTAPLTRIEYANAQAVSVFIAGTFNDWHPNVTEMLEVGKGRWAKELTLPPGTHEYRLVVDGQWMADPACQNSVSNPYGGRNSVLTVPG